ncbi:2-phospho-L-lactate guanylyltransferase [Subtercola sp. YIM 133946]|uniref:2-phospho-L-lactate guanylyltransferase n=1 Tax=Subtercola sp. YIM 133946 TaxID=3118909 RepID=UPI002F92068C
MTDWIVVVPVKGSTASKTRLADFPLSPVERRRLALAFALDTVGAIAAVADVRQLVVVTSDPEAASALAGLGAQIVPDPGDGLNAAIAAGLERARRTHPDSAVAVITADLPTLATRDVAEALELAAGHPTAFVADADGTGTTTITAQPHAALTPAFGPGSAARHVGLGMTSLALPEGSTLRRDVDTPADLERALRQGVGPHTARALAHPVA